MRNEDLARPLSYAAFIAWLNPQITQIVFRICVICGSMWAEVDYDGDLVDCVEIPPASRHPCVSTTPWNSALLQTQPRTALGSCNRCGLSSRRLLLLVYTAFDDRTVA